MSRYPEMRDPLPILEPMSGERHAVRLALAVLLLALVLGGAVGVAIGNLAVGFSCVTVFGLLAYLILDQIGPPHDRPGIFERALARVRATVHS